MRGIRITGGKLKGRSIGAPKRGPARFTSAKVREAIFDIIGGAEGLSVLDLFAGAGSLSAEALSRGAASVMAVEIDKHAAALISRNLRILGGNTDCLVLNMDVRYAVPMLHRQGKRFDLIFADPPYEMGYVSSTMNLLKKNPLWREGATIILEYSKREEWDCRAVDCGGQEVRRYGDTNLAILRCGDDDRKNVENGVYSSLNSGEEV
jgi:16S rRNA (guanine966-N2)-methyltransferase